MLKNNKWNLLLTSIVIILPGLASYLLCDNVSFLIPTMILFILQWLCVLAEEKINGNREQNKKVQRLVLWILPFTSIFVNAIFCATVLRKTDYLMTLICLFIGFLFIVIGNYLPKCKQNMTIGIKLKWTLANEENWNATHRFCGKVWVMCGFIVMLCSFLPAKLFPWVMIPTILAIVLPTLLYSYLYYQKQVRLGTAPKKPVVHITKTIKSAGIIGIVIGIVVVILAILALLTGDVSLTYKESSVTVRATYWRDMEIDYASINNIEYREDFDIGMRVMGFGSPRLNLGDFQNDELGGYTIYARGKAKTCVVLDIDGEYIVISLKDVSETKTLYDTIIDWRTIHESN